MNRGGLTGLSGFELGLSIVGALMLFAIVAGAGGWAVFGALVGAFAGFGLVASEWGADSRDGRDW